MHTIQKCYKKHYLISCANCNSMFHTPMKDLKFEKHRISPTEKIWRSKTLVKCPGCESERAGAASRWYWLPSRKPKTLHSLYERDISCNFGRITHMQLYAPGKNYLFFSSSTVGHVRGTFLSEDSHFRIELSTHCDRHESAYVLKPFQILIASKSLIMYRLADVCLTESKPFVFMNIDENYALLSRSCDFTARVTYLDPIFAFAGK